MRLTEHMREVVDRQALGFVATVNADGTPNLSAKGTTAVWDNHRPVFAHLHSPGTVRNIREGRRAVEVNVVDPFVRKGYRFRGTAVVHDTGPLFAAAVRFYEQRSGCEASRIHAIVVITVDAAEELVSPAYDDGSAEAEIKRRFLKRYGLQRTHREPVPVAHPEHMSEPRGALLLTTDPHAVDVAAVHGYLSRTSYWARGIPRPVVERSVRCSLPITVREGSRQIAFARVVTDYSTFAYLADVFVVADRRGRGVGAWLVRTAVGHPALATVRRWLLATSDAHGLYARHGFVALRSPHDFMEIARPYRSAATREEACPP